ncbi:hypothetical protein BSZ04_22625 [Vibrio rotiferianus]|nr:hypothetical protein BSZ04_22625 [Vibrio rotiferianus]
MVMNIKNQLSKKTIIATSVASVLLAGCGGGGDSSSSNSNQPEPQKNALVKSLSLSAGSSECSNGGLKVIAGYDDDNNGVLDDNEFVSNQIICHDGTGTTQDEGHEIFQQALVSIALIAKTDTRCDAGGQQVNIGIDKNSNSILDTNEIETSEVLCSIGGNFAPSAVINSITASPAVVAVGANTRLTATISNISPSDKITWKDAAGNTLETNANTPEQVEVTVGNTVGQEVFNLTVETTNDNGQTVTQNKEIIVTVAEAPSPTQSVVLDSKQVFLPDGFTTSALTGDVTGTIIYAKAISGSGGENALPTPNNTELAGFVAERASMQAGQSSEEILTSSVSAFASQVPGSVTQTSQTILSNGDINATYKLSLYSGKKLTELLDTLVNQVAVNKIGGVASSLVPAASETAQLEYQLDITVSYDPITDTAIITSTLVQSDKVSLYSDLIVSTTSESIQASKSATLTLHNDSFTAVDQTSSKADFLFVIDNSGSMAGEQQEISDLTQAFTDTISKAGVDFMVGTITTDSDVLRGQGFTNDITQIASDFKPGIYGSSRERGIYYSEKALSPGGTVELAGYPRPGASLSVVIMSDERSQYQRYSSDPAFDPKKNLFVDNGYRVYAIVTPSHASKSQYDDLAISTLGRTLNIQVTSEYHSFIKGMALDAGATSAGYKLTKAETKHILSSSINVLVNNQPIDRQTADGWQYYPLAESIVFTGSAIPNKGDKITVAYQYVEDVK